MNNLFNEAERYLLENWSDAASLEESMEAIRKKYENMVQQALNQAQQQRPELDVASAFATQFWGIGWIGLSKTCWEASNPSNRPGLWISGIRLEILASSANESPAAIIWASPKDLKKRNRKVPETIEFIWNEAKNRLGQETASQFEKGTGSDGTLIRAPMASKAEILEAIQSANGDRFSELIVSAFDDLGPLVPAIDEIFNAAAPGLPFHSPETL